MLKQVQHDVMHYTRVFADAMNMKTQKTEGLKAPGYSCSRLSDVFSLTTHHSQLITHRSLLTTQTLKAQRQGRDYLSLGKCNVF